MANDVELTVGLGVDKESFLSEVNKLDNLLNSKIDNSSNRLLKKKGKAIYSSMSNVLGYYSTDESQKIQNRLNEVYASKDFSKLFNFAQDQLKNNVLFKNQTTPYGSSDYLKSFVGSSFNTYKYTGQNDPNIISPNNIVSAWKDILSQKTGMNISMDSSLNGYKNTYVQKDKLEKKNLKGKKEEVKNTFNLSEALSSTIEKIKNFKNALGAVSSFLSGTVGFIFGKAKVLGEQAHETSNAESTVRGMLDESPEERKQRGMWQARLYANQGIPFEKTNEMFMWLSQLATGLQSGEISHPPKWLDNLGLGWSLTGKTKDFEMIAEAISRLPTNALQATAAVDAFKDAGFQIGFREWKKTGDTDEIKKIFEGRFSERELEKMNRAGRAMREFNMAWDNLLNSLASSDVATTILNVSTRFIELGQSIVRFFDKDNIIDDSKKRHEQQRKQIDELVSNRKQRSGRFANMAVINRTSPANIVLEQNNTININGNADEKEINKVKIAVQNALNDKEMLNAMKKSTQNTVNSLTTK